MEVIDVALSEVAEGSASDASLKIESELVEK